MTPRPRPWTPRSRRWRASTARSSSSLAARDKGADFTLLRKHLTRKVRMVVLVGQASDKIEKAIQGSVAIEKASSYKDVVRKAFGAAEPRRRGSSGPRLHVLGHVRRLRAAGPDIQTRSEGSRPEDRGEIGKAMELRRLFSFDKPLIVVTVILLLIGIVMVFSSSVVLASEKYHRPFPFSDPSDSRGRLRALHDLHDPPDQEARLPESLFRLRAPAFLRAAPHALLRHALGR